jgi:trehalose 6-phosphate phosphatase
MTTVTHAGLPPPPILNLQTQALFIDFDGTLVEIAQRPDQIRIDADLRLLLAGLGRAMSGCLVVVSGRSIAALDSYLGGAVPLLAGIHGAEIRGIAGVDPEPVLQTALDRVRQALRTEAGGLLVEDKALSIALHYRETPELAAWAESLAQSLAVESKGILSVQPGHMVVELKPFAARKGDVVRLFLADPSFRGRRPVFIGDDLTDESGFEAALAAGGHGVLVGASRPTAARFGLAGVGAVRSWLSQPKGTA